MQPAPYAPFVPVAPRPFVGRNPRTAARRARQLAAMPRPNTAQRRAQLRAACNRAHNAMHARAACPTPTVGMGPAGGLARPYTGGVCNAHAAAYVAA